MAAQTGRHPIWTERDRCTVSLAPVRLIHTNMSLSKMHSYGALLALKHFSIKMIIVKWFSHEKKLQMVSV